MGIIETLLIGLLVGFIFYELTGISAGGVIAPAYFALSIHQPGRLLVTVAIAFVVFAILRFLSGRLIIYGRRRLLLAIIIGLVIKLVLEMWIMPRAVVGLDLHSIGYIIPGLVGNEMCRQKVMPTLLGLGIVSIVIYLILIIL